jgi:anti-sigma regulatory factor (Ser/Thr protein kinase)
MEVNEYSVVAVHDATQAGAARRLASDLAARLLLDPTVAGKVAIVVTEAATNLAKHATHGEILLRAVSHGETRGIGILALDRGPGMTNLGQCLGDGFSTAGSPGTGLGAIARQASVFDIYSSQRGTVLMADVWARDEARNGTRVEVGVVSLSKPGEDVCGDAWAVSPDQEGGRSLVMVVDGLGHGAGAAEAARAAIDTFHAHAPHVSPAAMLERMHEALRPTRGAAAGVAEMDRGAGVIRFGGIGNISAAVITDAGQRNMVSHHGTLGHDVRKIQEFSYPWPSGAPVVLHSDGIGTRWSYDAYPGLVAHHPMVAAGVFYRDFRRERDDATVVVLRESA